MSASVLSIHNPHLQSAAPSLHQSSSRSRLAKLSSLLLLLPSLTAPCTNLLSTIDLLRALSLITPQLTLEPSLRSPCESRGRAAWCTSLSLCFRTTTTWSLWWFSTRCASHHGAQLKIAARCIDASTTSYFHRNVEIHCRCKVLATHKTLNRGRQLHVKSNHFDLLEGFPPPHLLKCKWQLYCRLNFGQYNTRVFRCDQIPARSICCLRKSFRLRAAIFRFVYVTVTIA